MFPPPCIPVGVLVVGGGVATPFTAVAALPPSGESDGRTGSGGEMVWELDLEELVFVLLCACTGCVSHSPQLLSNPSASSLGLLDAPSCIAPLPLGVTYNDDCKRRTTPTTPSIPAPK